VAALNIHALGQASHLPNLLVTVFHHTPVETKKMKQASAQEPSKAYKIT
jgi:hypothetical protein